MKAEPGGGVPCASFPATPAFAVGGTLAADPETYGVRVVCLQCGHDCHVAPLPGRGGHRGGQKLPDDDSPRSA